eukprot:CAMPEP_0119103124 /NCGR_PEP_ID=MMETSP1180-20130426/1660_1 /TAXON_ID=3052 ORGANISM="Chlamydomonas cf sp, Strain CCMP681" /NCGR_SAMPLE_ID=MMETSP1180 /ASSEMBLY_ACC=CAM_ASM_000741 /LENGTH=277 /DNA_ID=CAMNT_0007087565 /DNA_START=42 /DNA_END=875 /DNA_ORIENTATION=-
MMRPASQKWLLMAALLALFLGPQLALSHECPAAEGTASLEAEIRTLKSELSNLRASLEASQKAISKSSAVLSEKESSLTQCHSKLTEAGKASQMDFGKLMAALSNSVQAGATRGIEEIKAVAQEMSSGKFDKLHEALACTTKSIRSAFSSVVSIGLAQLQHHTPPAVKEQMSQAQQKAAGLWKAHVVDAAWAQPLLRQAAALNAELKRLVTQGLSSHPSMAPFADPVTVQLIVGAVFALPVVLLLVLPFALGGSTASKETARPFKGKPRGKGKPHRV